VWEILERDSKVDNCDNIDVLSVSVYDVKQTDTLTPSNFEHTHTHNRFMALWILPGITRVNQ